MAIRRITDIHGFEHYVDTSTSEILDYCNREGWIEYNARVVRDGNVLHYVNYRVEGTVDSIEWRCATYNNPIKYAYTNRMNFNASKNDPDGIVWRNTIEWAEAHQDELFDEFGDWKKVVKFNPMKETLEIVKSKRGGRRVGSGRMPSEIKKATWSVKVSEDEKQKLIEYLKKIREEV